MRILIVEDNQKFCRLVVEHIEKAGYAVDHANTAGDFRELMHIHEHCLYIVDLMLPDENGLSLIRDMRARQIATPILIMTARSRVDDRILGLDEGADDYLIKPFNHNELLARVRALLRRAPVLAGDTLEAGQLVLDCTNGDIFCGNQRIELRPSEQRLLALLIRRAGRLVARSAIENALQSMGDERSPNALDKLVSRLRRTLNNSTSGLELKTVRGEGYVLEEQRKSN